MRLSPEVMLDRFLAGDATYNGRFYVGVLTTGIYCLPSCYAKKPKVENVRFFQDIEKARQAGLRSCKKCRPDDFHAGTDAEVERLEEVVAALRASPSDFPGVSEFAKKCGWSQSKLFESVKKHYHSTPFELMTAARVRAAMRHLQEGVNATEAAAEVGYESDSAFYENFQRLTGLSPARYRRLMDSSSFELELPKGYSVPYLLRSLGRDAGSVTAQLVGKVYSFAFELNERVVEVSLEIGESGVLCKVDGPADMFHVHRVVSRVLGLWQGVESFEAALERNGLARLLGHRRGLRIVETVTVFDSLVWSIVGQQISLPFAFTLLKRLTEKVGAKGQGELVCMPTPVQVANLEVQELLPLQYSQRKAEYLIETSRKIVSGELPVESMPDWSASRTEATLLRVRGLGPWSVNYVMMRGLGFLDCTPLGDTGLRAGLERFYGLGEKPTRDEIVEMMKPFAPYRSLATNHLWHSLKESV